MAEVSEAFYAGLSLIGNLKEDYEPDEFALLYDQVVGKKPEKTARGPNGWGTFGQVSGDLSTWQKDIGNRESIKPETNLEKSYSNLAQGISAVLATRSFTGRGVPDAVYVTGGTWPAPVQKFVIAENEMGIKDYNSSDVVLQYGKNFVGVSLKIKTRDSGGSPTMINMSFQNIFKGNESWATKALNDINKARRRHFAGVIKEASGPDGVLNSVVAKEFFTDKVSGNKTLAQLNPNLDADAKIIWEIKVPRMKATYVNDAVNEKTGKPLTIAERTKRKEITMIPLINLKGVDELQKGLNDQLGPKPKDDFRKVVNKSLYSDGVNKKLNPMFQEFLGIMRKNQVADKLADSLLDKTLKLRLLDNIAGDFDFMVVTGTGNAKPGKKPTISKGNVADIQSIIVAGLMLKNQPASIDIDEKTTYTAKGAARLGFIISKGDIPVLNLELRYKGDFAGMPQFLGTMTSEYKDFLKNNKGRKALEGLVF